MIEADLILFDLHSLDVILSIDWLEANYASLDSFRKEMTFRRLSFPKAMFYGKQRSASLSLISNLSAHHLLRKGCIGFLA